MVFPSLGIPVYVIAKTGYGIADIRQELSAYVPGEPYEFYESFDSEGSSLIFEGGFGTELRVMRKPYLAPVVEFTYRCRDLGECEGRMYYEGRTTNGTIVDSRGNVLGFDFSGFAVKLGLGVGL